MLFRSFVVELTERSMLYDIGTEKTLTLISSEENGAKYIVIRCRMEEE